MILFKACPKCDGDLFNEGDELICIQCGYRRYNRKDLMGNPLYGLQDAQKTGKGQETPKA